MVGIGGISLFRKISFCGPLKDGMARKETISVRVS